MKSIIILLISFLVISCKSNSKLIGEYQANLSDSTHYTFNFANKIYTHKWSNGTFSKGKFKILDLSFEKKLLVCDELIHRKVNRLMKETNNCGDSIIIGAYLGYERFGATTFEIALKEDTLSFRKTYANELQKTEREGILIKR